MTEAQKHSLQCYENFMSRLSNIYSDNGTNFVGRITNFKHFTKFYKNVNFREIVQPAANEGIHGQFIPSNSPYFGGLREAEGMSMKFHL